MADGIGLLFSMMAKCSFCRGFSGLKEMIISNKCVWNKNDRNLFINTLSIGIVLFDEFMEPMQLSAYRLAKEINVPVSRIQDILHGRRTITADTALRLARYFGVEERYFLDRQTEIELKAAKEAIMDELEKIQPSTKNKE